MCSKEESGKLLHVKCNFNHSIRYPSIWLFWQKPFESDIIFQGKIPMMFYLRSKQDHCEDIFTSKIFLTLSELLAYELLIFLLRSVTLNHAKAYLKDLFATKIFLQSTRCSPQNLLQVPALKSQLQQCCLKMSIPGILNSFICTTISSNPASF